MLATPDLLNGLSPELTLRFFATFARLEFALKQCRYLRYFDPNDTAQVSQDRLIERLGDGFFAAVRDANIAATLIAVPPKHFVVDEYGGVQFGNQPAPVTSTDGLIRAAWRVRNNLFHGNKLFPADRARDENLMANTLALIEMILNHADEVSSAFHDPQ